MKPYYEHAGITIYNADCRKLLHRLKADVVVTDPPYGADKAGWDIWPEWIEDIAIARTVALLPGTMNLWRMGQSFGGLPYRWTLSAYLPTPAKSPLGLAHWHPCVIYAHEKVSLCCQKADAGQCLIVHDQPIDHPTPKARTMMEWVLDRMPEGVVFDPFMGSGTTLVAAKNLGRKAIGVEIDEKYCAIAVKRLRQEVLFPAVV